MSAVATNQSNQPNSINPTSDLQSILPKCLEIIGNDAKSAELRIAYDAPTHQTTYQYTLVWEDASQGAEEKYRVAITEANKIMLALKAKKLKKSLGSSEKNSTNGVTQNPQAAIESHYQELPFPPDLRSRSQQCEKSDETSKSSESSAGSSASSVTSVPITSEPEKSQAKFKEFSMISRSSRKTVGCFDDTEKVSVKVIVIDQTHFRGKLRPIASVVTTPTTVLKKILVDVIHEHYEGLPAETLIQSSGILYAFHNHNKAQRLRRIHNRTVDTLPMTNLPRLKGHIVVILDLVNHIEKGKKIPIQLDFEED